MMKILIFLVSFALFVGGIYLIGEAWSIPQWEGLVFISGILGVTLSFFIPFVVVPNSIHKDRFPKPDQQSATATCATLADLSTPRYPEHLIQRRIRCSAGTDWSGDTQSMSHLKKR